MRTDGGALYTQIEDQLPNFVQTSHPKFAKFIEKYYEFLELNLITFNDLDLNEDKPIQEVDDVTYTVTVAIGNNDYSNAVNKYFVGGVVSPTLDVSTGITYIFDQSDSTNLGHPLRISQHPDGRHTPDGEEYSNGVNVVAWGTPGTATAQTSVYISPDVANTYLYYYCNNHSGMGGNVWVANTTPYISLENGSTDVANTNSNYIDLENPNRQGQQFLSGETIKGDTSGATGRVKGKYSNTQAYVQETNNGNFQTGETIRGLTSRVSANVTGYLRQPLNASRNVKHFQDVDKAPAGFVELFRKEFLQGVPKGMLANKASMLKHIKDFYRAKGNESSFQFIFRLLYGKEDVTFYYPSTDILRLSDGRWTRNKTVKIDYDQADNFSSFEGRIIKGSVSNVYALVERTETYQIGSTTISELYLSNIDANNASYNAITDSSYTSFLVTDQITTTTVDTSGNYATAALTGIVSSVNIDSGGSNYKVGDEIQVSGGSGSEAGVKVSSVSDATISAFDITDPGDGFSVGDGVTFINEGTGGTGGTARVQTITPTANVFIDSLTINPHKDDLLSASAFTSPLQSVTANTHVYSNSSTTFSAGVNSTVAPKKGDLLIELSINELAVEAGCPTGIHTTRTACNADTSSAGHAAGNNNWPDYNGYNYTTEDDKLFDTESDATISAYNANNAKFGTVVSVDTTTTPNTVIYALGSIVINSTTGAKTIRNFEISETVFVYDTQKDGTGSPASENGHNAVFSDTGVNIVFANTPSVYSSGTTLITSAHHGALSGTITEAEIGGIRSLQVLSSGQGYTSIPVVSIANTTIESYGNALDKVGANSVFVTLASAIANQFTSNTIVKNQGNTATGIVLGPILSSTDLVATGNTVLRVQMTSSTNFSASDTLTAYTNITPYNPVGIGDFGTADVATSGATATFTQAAHGLTVGQRIIVSGSASGTDADVYNNTHTIASVTDASTFTVTFPSTPTDTSESNLRTRRVVTANVATTNSVFANTGSAGNNATISIASIAIGAIQSVSIYNFGANYLTAPTLDASGVGGKNATLTATLGALAEYDGFFDGPFGVLSGQNKMQDNYYYQDFSYVIKTDVDTKTYRDQILNLVHPAGLKMFGEVSMISNAAASLWNGNTVKINDVGLNPALTGGSTNVPHYRLHELTIANQNTVSSNTQITIQTSLFRPAIAAPAFDLKIKFPSADYDLVLEHDNAGIAVESAGDTIGFETVTGGTLVLDDGSSRIQLEEYFDSIVQENESNLELEEASLGIGILNLLLEDGDRILLEGAVLSIGTEVQEGIILEDTGSSGIHAKNYLLEEPTTESTQLISEDYHDSFNFVLEEDGNDYLIEQEGTEYSYILAEDGTTRIMGIDYSVEALRITLEIEEHTVDTNFKVVDRVLSDSMALPKIQFPEEFTGAVHIDLGFGSQLRLEDNEYLLLERTEGMFPLYLAMEDTMQDEVIQTTEIQIVPMALDEVPAEAIGIVIDNPVHTEDQTWLAENGNRFIYDSVLEAVSKASAIVINDVNLPYGTNSPVSYTVKEEGNINASMGEEFELLAENGDRYVEESTEELVTLASEAGETYLLEQSYLSNQRLASDRAADTSKLRQRSFISEDYKREATITGTNTFFDEIFNAPIVLEDDDEYLISEYSGQKLESERGNEFQTEHTDRTTSYVTLETNTDDSDLLLSEADNDRVFLPLQLEDVLGGGNLRLEITENYSASRRLVTHDLLDVIVEEEGISLEEDDRILMEDYCGGPADQFLAEDGSYFKLNHNSDNLGTEGILGIQHLTQEQLSIEDFHGKLGLEGTQGDVGSIILEVGTSAGIGITLLTENGDRLLNDHTNNDSVYLLGEHSFARTSANSKIIVIDDSRLIGYETDNLVADNYNNQYEVNFVAEDGSNLTAESTRVHDTTIEVELVDEKWPHGVIDNARIIFADGDTATVIEKVDDYRINVDLGGILLEDAENPITKDNANLVLEADGGKILFNYGQSTSQNYRLEYGRYTQESQEGKLLVEETSDANDIGRAYQFTINGITTDGTTLPNIHEWSEIHGDNIVYESGENILMEDGEIDNQDPNALLLEWENQLLLEDGIDSVILETGRYIILEDDTDDGEYLNFEESPVVTLEDIHYNHKLLNFEPTKYRIEYIANNTFMKLSQEVHLFTDASIRVNHLEQVPS